MERALFGTETEYAMAAVDTSGRVVQQSHLTQHISERAAALPHLRGNESGIFLPNGGRFYIDCGHPEYASPETTNPWDAVRYARAGDSLMSKLTGELALQDPTIARVVLRKGNVDYTARTTWGNHENYLHRNRRSEVRAALVPHLVSRIVFTGGGGLDPFDNERPRFVLSPRVLFIRQVNALSTPDRRALVDERAQPHCAGYHRQHLMCGDAVQSNLAMFLQIGTTALIIALADAGCADEERVRLAEPLAALSTVARDVTLREPLDLTSGRRITALDIQRHYLQRVIDHLDRLPPWAGAVCDLWRSTLDRLERGPHAVADRLDWAIKLAIYRDRAARNGQTLHLDNDAASETLPEGPSVGTTTWRAELFELDMRFAQLNPPGLFDALDHAGVLNHDVAGLHDIDRALTMPPGEGRARIRGEVVARLADHNAGVLCGWDRICDPVSSRALDLSDPFTTAEAWHELPANQPAADILVASILQLTRQSSSARVRQAIREVLDKLCPSNARPPRGRYGEHAITLNNRAFDLRNAGRLEEAEWLMRAALTIDVEGRPESHRKVPHRQNNLATVLLMQGRTAEARELVTFAWRQTGTRYDLTSARILVIRLAIALVDDEPSALFVGQLKTHVAIQPLPDFADVDRHWQMRSVLDVLAPRLDPGQRTLVKAIVDVLNGERSVESIEEIPWQETPAEALDTPWPIAGSGEVSAERDAHDLLH